MSTLVHSICGRTLVVGLVVASFAGASGSAFAASAASPYGYAMQYTPKAPVKKVPQRPKVVVERTDVLCDVLVGTAHAGDLRRCE